MVAWVAETTEDGEVDKRASFVCVLSLAWPDGHVESFEGILRGQLVFPPRGDKGFGYDPIFAPKGHDLTFGESLEAVHRDRGEVDEHVLAAVLFNEAVALGVVEPLHVAGLARCHQSVLPFFYY